jgi:hypothetical protein
MLPRCLGVLGVLVLTAAPSSREHQDIKRGAAVRRSGPAAELPASAPSSKSDPGNNDCSTTARLCSLYPLSDRRLELTAPRCGAYAMRHQLPFKAQGTSSGGRPEKLPRPRAPSRALPTPGTFPRARVPRVPRVPRVLRSRVAGPTNSPRLLGPQRQPPASRALLSLPWRSHSLLVHALPR